VCQPGGILIVESSYKWRESTIFVLLGLDGTHYYSNFEMIGDPAFFTDFDKWEKEKR